MKRLVYAGTMLLVLVSTLACSGGTLPGWLTRGVDIKIVNRSPDVICYVFVSSSDDDMWGEDQLGEEETIDSGSSRVFRLDDGTYDVRIEACGDVVMATAWEIASDTTLTIGERDADVRVVLVNDTEIEACYVLISTASSEDWGDDRLGAHEIVEPGDRRVFYVEPGIYDLWAGDCDDQVIAEQYTVDLTEDSIWTLED